MSWPVFSHHFAHKIELLGVWEGSESHIYVLGFVTADDRERHSVAWLMLGEQTSETVLFVYFVTGDFGDDVTFFDASLGGWAFS